MLILIVAAYDQADVYADCCYAVGYADDYADGYAGGRTDKRVGHAAGHDGGHAGGHANGHADSADAEAANAPGQGGGTTTLAVTSTTRA